MKKLLVVLGISLLAMMPMAYAVPSHEPLLGRHMQPSMVNGTFTGVFAEKNETGYVPLGNLSGTYDVTNMSGTFTGIWNLLSGNGSGTMEGWIWGHIFLGQLTNTVTNQTSWFAGIYRVNTTASTFRAKAFVLGEDDFMVRYITGSL